MGRKFGCEVAEELLVVWEEGLGGRYGGLISCGFWRPRVVRLFQLLGCCKISQGLGSLESAPDAEDAANLAECDVSVDEAVGTDQCGQLPVAKDNPELRAEMRRGDLLEMAASEATQL